MRCVWLCLALLAPALFAGCVREDGGVVEQPLNHVARECSAQALWHQPGLFAAIQDADLSDVRVFPLTSGPPRLAFPAEALPESWADARLWGVEWRRAETADIFNLGSPQPGLLEVTLVEGLDVASAKEGFRAFLRELALDKLPVAAEWETRFTRSIEEGARQPRAAVGAELDVAALVARVAREAPLEVEYGRFGHGILTWGAWSFGLRLPSVDVAAPFGVGGISLNVDAEDRVQVSTMVAPRELLWATLPERANESFARMGLPAPAFTGAEAVVVHCLAGSMAEAPLWGGQVVPREPELRHGGAMVRFSQPVLEL